MTQTVDQTTQHDSIGKSIPRKDAPDKLRGRARFAGDLPFPGLLHARLVLSPYAHARILSIDTSGALAIPGVVAVYTGETLGLKASSSRTMSPLATDEVFWSGHPVAVVLGETEAAAEDGVAAVDVDYDPLPVVIDPLAALQPASPLARPRKAGEAAEISGGDAHAAISDEAVAEEETEVLSENVCNKTHTKSGDIAAGWREAEVIVERSYRTHPVHQSYMEPQSITVVPSQSGHQMTVYPSTQGLFGVRSDIANALEMPERQIRVESVPIGGAFGGKFGLHEPLGAAVAHAAGRPVRLVYTRQEDLLAGNPAPQIALTIKLGAKRDGTLVALQAKAILDSGAYPGAGAGLAGHLLASTYRCPNLDIRCYEVLTNKVGVGAYRAPNAPQVTFALESTVNELCNELGVDPIAFRKQNALREGDATLDHRHPQWPRIGLVQCLEQLEQHPAWKGRDSQKEPPAELKGWKIGYGVAVGGWPGASEPTSSACRLERDGTLTIVLGHVDLTGSDDAMALIASEGLGLSPDAITVAHDNTDTMPYSGGTGGSKTVFSVGPAVMAAARDTRNQILTVAADMLEAAPGDLTIENGKVVVKGAPGKSVDFKDVAVAAMRGVGGQGPIYGRGNAAAGATTPMYAAHLAKVAVDPDTGEVRVLDYIAVQDVGCAINPAEVEGQIYGGVTQGLGWALFEGYEYDENGQLLTSTFMDYALPHSQDVPNITTILVEVPSERGPFGAKGVGEPPVIPVGAAIANAVADAVGVRVTEMPITPERLFRALQAR